MRVSVLILFLLTIPAYADSKAKTLFNAINLNCKCLDCDCKDCQCKQGECKCNDCHSFEAMYVKAIRDDRAIILEVGGVTHLKGPWRVVQVKSIKGEKPGYIVGVPKDGKLVRLNFSPITTRERIRLDILHVIYPLGNGYVECPTCPQGRIKGH